MAGLWATAFLLLSPNLLFRELMLRPHVISLAAGIVMLVNAAFNGLGQPLPATTISVTRMVIVYIPLAFAGRALFGIPGIFAAYAASNLFVGAGAAYWGWVACSRAPQRELAAGEA